MSWNLSTKGRNDLGRRVLTHEEQIEAEARQQRLRDATNAATRKQYLAGLEAKKQEQQKLRDAEIDEELEPKKTVLMREWLVDHPDKTSTDFEKVAWPLLRENLVEEIRDRQFEATKAAARTHLSGEVTL
jgi:hypothetical protein